MCGTTYLCSLARAYVRDDVPSLVRTRLRAGRRTFARSLVLAYVRNDVPSLARTRLRAERRIFAGSHAPTSERNPTAGRFHVTTRAVQTALLNSTANVVSCRLTRCATDFGHASLLLFWHVRATCQASAAIFTNGLYTEIVCTFT